MTLKNVHDILLNDIIKQYLAGMCLLIKENLIYNPKYKIMS